jgi:hypothetical protein
MWHDCGSFFGGLFASLNLSLGIFGGSNGGW